MIPNIFHFIYVGGRPFSFIHYLAVLTAWKVNRPEVIYFHHTQLPTGHWWELARPMLTLHAVEPATEVYGNPVIQLAHQADVIRLRMLREFGGIYLDLDVISINPLKPFMQESCVMGIESGTGLCNAVIMAQKDAVFLERWQQSYRDFRADLWNQHSVVVPWQLAMAAPETIHIEDQYAFFYPAHNDPAHCYLWGKRPSTIKVLSRTFKNIIRLAMIRLGGSTDAVKLAFYRTFHVLRGRDWHYSQLKRSYCVHLWEGLWAKPYLNAVTPDYLLNDSSHFARALRSILTREEIESMKPPAAAIL